MEYKEQNIKRILRQLIHFFRKEEKVTDEQEMDALWAQVQEKVNRQNLKIRYRKYIVSAAASAALIFGIYWTLNHLKPSSSDEDRIRDIAATMDLNGINSDEVLLVVSDDKQISLESDSVVTYSESGVISLKSDTIDIESEKQKEIEYNKLIVPKGKRMQLVLPDASRLWVNSGTTVIYPRVFTPEKREIFIDGEVYLEVSHRNEINFIVKTKDFDVQVLGTSFNICTYQGMESSVVLVNGIVNIQDNNGKKTELKPNQRIIIDENGLGSKKYVNALDYIGWIDNLLILNSESLNNVFRKLSIYYGVNIQVDESVNHLPLSGKLDLKSNITDVVSSISKTAPINYRQDGQTIIISDKQ